MSDARAPSTPDGESVPGDAGSSLEPTNAPPSARPAGTGPDGPAERPAAHPDREGDAGQDARTPEGEHPEGRVVDAEVVDELVQEVAMRLEASSGLILPAHDLYQYRPEHQERLFRIAEAATSDESERRTKAVDAGISTTRRSSIIQPALFALCLGLSAVSFWVFKNNYAGGIFLGYPVLFFLGGVRWNWRRQRQQQPPKKDE